MKFEIRESESITGSDYIVKIEESGREWVIPEDPANSDYQAYLRHLSGEDEAQSL